MQADAAGSFRARANHRSPQTGNAVRKLSHAAAGFTENPDADTHQLLYPVRAGDPFHYKKGSAENPCGAFFYHCFSVFGSENQAEHKLLVLCLPMAHGSILPAEVPDGLGSQAMPLLRGDREALLIKPHRPCRTG